MNPRTIVRISVALNLALAIGLVLLIKQRSPVVPELPPAPPRMAVQPAVAITAPTPLPPIRQPARPFRWSQVLSEDLKVYRDNLRAIGCPALTVHDIIRGEINERFELRRRALLNEAQSRFWDAAVHGELAIRYEWEMPMRMMARERQEMIDDILKEYGPAVASAESDRELMQRHLGWLPAEKRDQLYALEQKRQRRLDEWVKSVGDRLHGELTPEDEAGRLAVQKEFDAARNELLTPEELEESRIRDSKESLWAIGLSGFEPTAEEWRKVTKLRVDAEAAQRNLADANLSDEERLKRSEELQSRLIQETRETLGGERFAQYEMANDGQFQEVRKVTQRYGLPDNIATQACDALQAATALVEKVRGDSNLSEETRQAALTAIQRETERTLARTLGEKVLATYKVYGGQWLAELSQGGSD